MALNGSVPSFLPVLVPSDVERAIQLIQQAYSPQSRLSSEEQRHLQQELFEIQRRPEAWGLVIPFLAHIDPNVQFFGVHTAQVKIARDWSSFPQDSALSLRDLLLELTGRSVSLGHSKVILRKLFIAITTLAIKICPGTPSPWPEWLPFTVRAMSQFGVPRENLLDFLAIAAEEVQGTDLLPQSKAQMTGTLREAVPLVIEAVTTCIGPTSTSRKSTELTSALKCLQAWMSTLPASDLTPLIPALLTLMVPDATGQHDEQAFVAASDTLQEVMGGSSLSDGAGSKTITEPLLLWLDRYGGPIIQSSIDNGFVSDVSHSLCKLLVALGDHSAQYFAKNIASPVQVQPIPCPFPLPPQLPLLSHLVQTFLRILLGYTGLPGYYGVDEEESEMTLAFWYLFQESLWNSEFGFDGDEEEDSAAVTLAEALEREQMPVAKAVYSELVVVLRKKVTWPPKNVLINWPRDQRDKFQTYRRDVGDTLINAYYVLRADMLAFYVNDIVQKLSTRTDTDGWEEVEASLHCIMAVQEAVPIEDSPHLRQVFGPEILGRLTRTGDDRIRRTALNLIGSYASWFTTQPEQHPESPVTSPLMGAIAYVVSGLSEPALCLSAANALRDLCDANRAALAPHMAAFGELHAGIASIPDTEKSKVLQSIASVIQALPPAEEIPPIEAIVSPVIAKLFEALQSSSQLPDEARAVAVQQLETLTGVARGLTRTTDSLLVDGDSDDTVAKMRQAREDPRATRLREGIMNAIRSAIELWSTDATVSDALSELFRAITALPSDITLISLPPGPLLQLICVAAQRQLTAVWLSLGSMLILQLNPPTLMPTTLKVDPPPEALETAVGVLGMLLQTSLNSFSQPGAMESNPDIVQAFFGFMEYVLRTFLPAFYKLHPDLFNTLVQCAIGALSLQERYSLTSASHFLSQLITRTATTDELVEAKAMLGRTHGHAIMRAVLFGFAGVAPRSALPHLLELLTALTSRYPLESKAWATEILYASDFYPCKATDETKEKFLKTVFGGRSPKRTREATTCFMLVARGLEGSNFGHATTVL